MESISIKTRSEKKTRNIGFVLGTLIQKGDIICLTGGLGAGKTVFVKGIAKAFGIKEYVTSPTFTIVNEYKSGKIPLYHLDVYRISQPDDMYEIGFEEYIHNSGAVVIEWADMIKEILPDEAIWVKIKRGPSGEEDVSNNPFLEIENRTINISFLGNKYKDYKNRFLDKNKEK